VWQVAPGTDNLGSNYLTISVSGTSSAPIVFTCANPASWAWENGSTNTCNITSTKTGNSDVVGWNGSYVVLDGFNITDGSVSNGVNQLIYITGSHNTLSRSVLHGLSPDCTSNGGGGVQVAEGSDGYNTYDANVVYGFSCSSGTSNMIQYDAFLNETDNTSAGNATVTNNIIFNWPVTGIGMGNAGGVGNAVAANNLLIGVANAGIIYGDGTAGVFPNNIILNTTAGASAGGAAYYGCCSGSVGGPVTNNEIYGNAAGNSAYDGGGTFTFSGTLTANPASGMFVNYQTNGSGNYHSASGSPLVGAGTCTNAPNHDFDGNPRSGSCDIGPYQHTN
jgi:hypothetical protein